VCGGGEVDGGEEGAEGRVGEELRRKRVTRMRLSRRAEELSLARLFAIESVPSSSREPGVELFVVARPR
jgi:hypothetical protein